MLCWVSLLVLTVIWAMPILWILLTSFKTESEVIVAHTVFPKQWTLQSYTDVLLNPVYATQMPIMRWFGNSLFISSVHTILAISISALSAYAYARLEFKGRDLLFMMQLSTLMIPAILKVVALYRIMIVLHWVDTPWSMIFPGLGEAGILFLLRQFMMSIPREQDEAAMLDGAGKLRIFWHVILPQCKPSLIISGVFVFLANWNDFMWPVIITNGIEHRTLTSGLKVLQSAMFNQYAKLAVAAVISSLPVIVLYLVAQKYLIKGLKISSERQSF